MRLLIVDGEPLPDATERDLEAAGIAVLHASGVPENPPRTELAVIAEELLAFERLVDEETPDAIFLGSASNAALAAILVAAKAGVRVARVDASSGGEDRINRALLDQLVDATLAPDPETLISWARAT